MAYQIAGFLNFNISKTIGFIKFNFLHAVKYLLKLQIDDVILDGHGQACPGMPGVHSVETCFPKEVGCILEVQ